MSLFLRLALAFGASTAVFGAINPYLPIWYAAHGLTPAEIGWLAAAGTGARILAAPLFGVLADRSGSARPWLIGLTAAGAGAVALYGVGEGFWPLLGIAWLVSFCLTPLGSLIDGVTLAQPQLDYGRMRLWASIAYVAAIALAGMAVQAFSIEIILALGVGVAVATVPAVAVLPPGRGAMHRTGGIGALLRDRRILLVFLAAGLIQNSHVLLNVYGSLHWASLGIPASDIGWLWVAGVVAEIALFFVAPWFGRGVTPAVWMLLGGSVAVLRWGLAVLAVEPWMLVCLQMMHAFSFAATHLGTLALLRRLAPEGRYGTVMGIYAALPTGVGAMASQALAGQVFETMQGGAYVIMATMAAFGTLTALPLLAGERRAAARPLDGTHSSAHA